MVFDESGNFLIFAGLLGIKVSIDIMVAFMLKHAGCLALLF